MQYFIKKHTVRSSQVDLSWIVLEWKDNPTFLYQRLHTDIITNSIRFWIQDILSVLRLLIPTVYSRIKLVIFHYQFVTNSAASCITCLQLCIYLPVSRDTLRRIVILFLEFSSQCLNARNMLLHGALELNETLNPVLFKNNNWLLWIKRFS